MSKVDQPCFVRVDGQPIFGEPFSQQLLNLKRRVTVREYDHEIVREPDQLSAARKLRFDGFFEPLVQYIVQVDIRKDRGHNKLYGHPPCGLPDSG